MAQVGSERRSRFTATGSGTEHSLLPTAGLAGSASQPAARSFAKHSTPSVGCQCVSFWFGSFCSLSFWYVSGRLLRWFQWPTGRH